MTAPLIAIDWGTTSLRAALLGPGGELLDQHQSAQGILAVPAGEFAPVFIAACARWMLAGARFALMSGMVGSRQGWEEAPYCVCPAGLPDVAGALRELPPQPPVQRIAIVPGLRCERQGLHDVMRGEETQVFGALDLLGLESGVFVLPGTHSKWVTVQARRIEHFATFMTGEVYGLLRQHSILARTLPPEDGALDADAFLQGVSHVQDSGSLLQSAFSVRTRALFETLPAPFLPSYLSGLVIGEEIRARQPLDTATPLVLVGADALTARYALALQTQGVPVHRVGAEATWRGLWAIAQTMEGSS